MRIILFVSLCLACMLGQARAETSAEQCSRFASDPLESGHEASGIDLNKIDLSKALPSCIEAAFSPLATPQDHFRLSRAYYAAHQVELAASEAAKSANAGYPPGMYVYAILLKDGEGVERDEAAAVQFFASAAKMNFVEAEAALGEMIWNGQGIGKNKQLGVQWLNKAAKGGSSSAVHSLEEIARVEAVNQANARVGTWGLCKRDQFQQAMRNRQNYDGQRSSVDDGLTTGFSGPDGTCQ